MCVLEERALVTLELWERPCCTGAGSPRTRTSPCDSCTSVCRPRCSHTAALRVTTWGAGEWGEGQQRQFQCWRPDGPGCPAQAMATPWLLGFGCSGLGMGGLRVDREGGPGDIGRPSTLSCRRALPRPFPLQLWAPRPDQPSQLPVPAAPACSVSDSASGFLLLTSGHPPTAGPGSVTTYTVPPSPPLPRVQPRWALGTCRQTSRASGPRLTTCLSAWSSDPRPNLSLPL